METADAEIAQAALSGDKDAFGKLVIRYQGHIYGLAYSILGSWDDAQDTAQEAFIRAYLRLNQLRYPDKFAGWLKQITISLSMDRLRASRKESGLLISLDEANASEGLPVALPASSDQDEGYMEELALAQIRKLPRDYRIPLVLFHLNGLSYQAVSDFLEISVDAVRKRVQRARKMLRKEILDMMDDAFSQHQLSSEFAAEMNALFETYELAKEDESQRKDKIDGIHAGVLKVYEDGGVLLLSISPIMNRSQLATKELRYGPSGVLTEYYDHHGRRLKIRTEPADWHRDPYVIIETIDEVAPGGTIEGICVHRESSERVTSGHFPRLVRKDLIWNFRCANDSANWLNHTRVILPPSAIVLQCSPDPSAIWHENGRVCVQLEQYTGEWAIGKRQIAFLWPDRDGSCVRDISLLRRGKSPLAEEYERTLRAIRCGSEFDDQSTPLRAYLTYICGILHRDPDKLYRTTGSEGDWPQKDDDEGWMRWRDWLAISEFLNTPEWPEVPEELAVHPIFVAMPGSVLHNDVHLFVYSKGKWYRAGNLGNSFMEWQERVEWARSVMKERDPGC